MPHSINIMVDLEHVKKAKGLKFCHLNVRSILNKMDQFRMHFQHSGINVITLSETWLTDDISSCILHLKNYQLLRLDRSFTQTNNNNGSKVKKGGGLMTYLHKDLNFTPVVNEEKNISCLDCELQRIELCSTVQKNVLVYNIYRPPSGKIDTFF